MLYYRYQESATFNFNHDSYVMTYESYDSAVANFMGSPLYTFALKNATTEDPSLEEIKSIITRLKPALAKHVPFHKGMSALTSREELVDYFMRVPHEHRNRNGYLFILEGEQIDVGQDGEPCIRPTSIVSCEPFVLPPSNYRVCSYCGGITLASSYCCDECGGC